MNDVSISNPEIARTVEAGGVATNCHDLGAGPPVLMIHGSGPGVRAWVNWRLVMPSLAESFRVIAPDMVGIGFTERPAGAVYGMDTSVRHVVDLLDALDIAAANIV